MKTVVFGKWIQNIEVLLEPFGGDLEGLNCKVKCCILLTFDMGKFTVDILVFFRFTDFAQFKGVNRQTGSAIRCIRKRSILTS